jgi:MFS family permease
LIFLALSVPSFIGGLAGKVVDRFGSHYPSCIGLIIASIAVVCLRFVEHNVTAEKVLLVCLLAIVSVSVTLVQVSVMAEVFGVVAETEKHRPGVFGGKSPIAQVYALLSIAAACSHFCGPLLGGFVQEHAGWKIMTLALGFLCLFTAIPVGLFGGAPSPY